MAQETTRSEQRRLEALGRYQVLDTPAEPVFDDLAALAAEIVGTPTALISFIDADRHWSKAVLNFPVTQLDRTISFCDHTIRQSRVMTVEDATADRRFADNPLVTGSPAIRFYAGATLLTPDRHALGTICGIDYRPRTLTREQAEALERLARQVVRELEVRRRLSDLSATVTGHGRADEAHMMRAILERATALVHVKDVHGRYLLANEAFLRRLGRSREEVLGSTDEDLLDPVSAKAHRRNDLLALASREPVEVEEVLDQGNGPRNYTTVKFPLLDWRGAAYATCGFAMDVTDRVRAEEDSRRSAEYVRKIVQGALDGIVASSADGTVTEFNPAAERIYGYTRDEALGRDVGELLIPPAYRSAQMDEVAAHLRGEPSQLIGRRVEVLGQRRDGDVFPLELAMVDLGADPGRFIGFVRDVSDRRHAEDQLRHLAEHDPHTGLANRTTFMRALTAAAGDADGAVPVESSVLLVDIDTFKNINDTLGHRAGDDCLRHVAEVLRNQVREADLVARLGGDEFAVLLPSVNPDQARYVAECLLEVLRERPAVIDGRAVRLTASVGVARVVGGAGPEDVLHLADAAMYQAKEAGRDRVVVYNDVRGEALAWSRYAGQAQRLRDALAEGRFTLYAQPIADLRTGETTCHELLVRMVDPETGTLIPPSAFLPAAERFDLIQKIDAWVVTEAVRLVRLAEEQGAPVPTVQVNLSGRSLSDSTLLRTLEEQIVTVDPRHLVFEVTETAAVTHLDTAIAFTSRLAELGCGLALDDFGAGYASFYYLKHLPVRSVKIDGDFIRGILTDRLDRAVVHATVSLAEDMGYDTVAEHVETPELLQELRRYHLRYVQGYHIGRPQPAAQALGLRDEP